MQVLDFDEPVLIQPPRVLVIDREYGSGRQFLNSAEVMHTLYHRWYQSIEVVYMRLKVILACAGATLAPRTAARPPGPDSPVNFFLHTRCC